MILIPARNEAARVAGVVRGARSACPGVPVVVVANGCTDDTVERARAAGAEVVHSRLGYARALRAGYRHAVRSWDEGRPGPRWVVQLDADGQHPTAAIGPLSGLLGRADLVIGSRFGGGRWPEGSWGRQAATAMLGIWASGLMGQRVLDVTSGFQALGEPVVRSFSEHFPDEVADANVLVRAKRMGFRILEAPVVMAPRVGGESMHRGWRSSLYAARVVALAVAEARG